MTWYAFVTQAVAVEDRSKSDALSRSKQLSAGHRWTIFGVGVVVVLAWLLLLFTASLSLAVADIVNDLAFELPTVVFLIYFPTPGAAGEAAVCLRSSCRPDTVATVPTRPFCGC
jgi:hypothetical protein